MNVDLRCVSWRNTQIQIVERIRKRFLRYSFTIKNDALNRFIRPNLNRISGFNGSEKSIINSSKTLCSHRFSPPPPSSLWLLNNIHKAGEHNIPQYSSRARRSSLLVQLSSCFLHFENKRRLELEIRRF